MELQRSFISSSESLVSKACELFMSFEGIGDAWSLLMLDVLPAADDADETPNFGRRTSRVDESSVIARERAFVSIVELKALTMAMLF